MLKVAIIGASGYSGCELVRILSNHPEVELTYLTSTTYIGEKISDIYTNLKGTCDLNFVPFNLGEVKEKAEVVFLALSHGMAMEILPELLDEERKIIDLSGDFRLSAEIYKKWYGKKHKAPELIAKAVYGLPEVNREKVKEALFISNPGCYPTNAIIATAPLLSSGLIDEEKIVINSLSGLSGAGRGLKESLHFCQADENVAVYKVGGIHQHVPEMEQEMTKIGGASVKVTFTPHLAPFSRGIFSTVTAPLKKEIATKDLLEIFSHFYRDEYFIQVLPEGVYPEVKKVVGSNFCQLGLEVDNHTGQVLIFSALDNLGKGAAGQAIQNMNIWCGLEETTGLRTPGIFP